VDSCAQHPAARPNTQPKESWKKAAQAFHSWLGRHGSTLAAHPAYSHNRRAQAPAALAVKQPARRATYGPDQVITLVSKSNPKRKGTASYRRFALYETGQTVACALKKGMRRADLIWDTERRFITIK
jgi:hypothetical protein